jgi:hypothetical protein
LKNAVPSASRKSRSLSRRISSVGIFKGTRTRSRMYAAILFLIVIIFYNSYYGTKPNKPIVRSPSPRKHRRVEAFTKNFREQMRPKRRAVNSVQETLRNILSF